MTAMRAIEVDEATAAALEKSAAEQGVSVAELLAELAGALSPASRPEARDDDWSEDLARLAEYDEQGAPAAWTKPWPNSTGGSTEPSLSASEPLKQAASRGPARVP